MTCDMQTAMECDDWLEIINTCSCTSSGAFMSASNSFEIGDSSSSAGTSCRSSVVEVVASDDLADEAQKRHVLLLLKTCKCQLHTELILGALHVICNRFRWSVTISWS